MRLIVWIVVLLLSLTSAYSDKCLSDLGGGNVCTANDFQLTEETIYAPSTCFEGEMLPPVTIRLHIIPTASQRYDIGFFIGDNGESPIDGTSCTVEALTPPESTGNPFDPLSGSGPYRDLDGNGCGDTQKIDGEIVKDIVLDKVLCIDDDHDGQVDVKYALTWQQQSRASCDPGNSADLNPPNASKCLVAGGNIAGVIVKPKPEVPSIFVTKSASPTHLAAPGGPVEYTLSVENNGTEPLTLVAFDDDRFGPIDGNGTCSLPQGLQPGESYSCYFTTDVYGTAGSTHRNTVTASAENATGTVVTDSDYEDVVFEAGNSSFIGDAVFDDLNGNGIRENGEPGLNGVEVQLFEANDTNFSNPLATETTDPSGAYGFEGFLAGDYLVRIRRGQTVLNNYVLTTNNIPMPVTLASDLDEIRYADFGFAIVKIELVKSVDQSVIHAPGSTVTYSYTAKNSGPVTVVPLIMYDDHLGDLQTLGCSVPAVLKPQESFGCSVDADISGSGGDRVENIALFAVNDTEGYFHSARDSAVVEIEDAGNAALGHFVWHDRNGNGVYDRGEPGFDDVTLALSGDDVNTTKTLHGGFYAFLHLFAGDYNVTVTDDHGILDGYVRTNGSGPYVTTLAASQIDPRANFGYALPSVSISKTADKAIVYEPGASVTFTVTVLNDGEVPLDVVKLDDSVFGELNATNSTCSLPVHLDVNATYSCTLVRDVNGSAGTTHNDTVTATATDPDDNNHTASDNESISIVSRIGGTGEIGYLVWNDANRNGIKDAGEAGIGGVTLDLLQGGSVIQTASTATDGTYQFHVANGTYEVNVTDQTGRLGGFELVSGTNPHGPVNIANNIYVAANFGYAEPLVRPSISVTKNGSTCSIVGSEEVVFTVDVENTSADDVVLTRLTDSIYDDLNGMGNCQTGVTIAAGTTYSCEFVQTVSGEAGQTHRNTVVAVAEDAFAQNAVGAGSWLIVFDANSSVAVPVITKEGRGLLMVLLALLGGIFLHRLGERHRNR